MTKSTALNSVLYIPVINFTCGIQTPLSVKAGATYEKALKLAQDYMEAFGDQDNIKGFEIVKEKALTTKEIDALYNDHDGLG